MKKIHSHAVRQPVRYDGKIQTVYLNLYTGMCFQQYLTRTTYVYFSRLASSHRLAYRWWIAYLNGRIIIFGGNLLTWSYHRERRFLKKNYRAAYTKQSVKVEGAQRTRREFDKTDFNGNWKSILAHIFYSRRTYTFVRCNLIGEIKWDIRAKRNTLMSAMAELREWIICVCK